MSPELEYLNARQRFQDLLACIGGSDDPDKAALILAIMAARKELDTTYTRIFHKCLPKSDACTEWHDNLPYTDFARER